MTKTVNSGNRAARRVIAILGVMLLLLGLVMPALQPSHALDYNYYTRFKGQDMELSVYNVGEYIPDGSDDLMDVVAEFEDLTGITVYYTNFATNEEMYAKIKGSNVAYDVIVPSDYMISRLIEEDMLSPLNKDNIPNLANIDPKFMDPEYDPGSVYSVPYFWGVVGIAYNEKYVDEPDSWDILWDPEYSGKILMFAGSRDAFAIACSRLGFSLNTTDEEELREAAALLVSQKQYVQAYVQDEIFDKMEAEEAWISPCYAGDAWLMSDNNESICFAFPEEGSNLFVDACCIPKNAEHQEAAEMFINFLNEPEVAAENAEYVGYASPNLAALELLDEEIVEDEVIYPSDETIAKTEKFLHLPEETNLLMDSLWTEVMAQGSSFLSWGLPPLLVIAAIIFGKLYYRHYKDRVYRYMEED